MDSINEVLPPDNDEIEHMLTELEADMDDARISSICAQQVIVKVLKMLNEGK